MAGDDQGTTGTAERFECQKRDESNGRARSNFLTEGYNLTNSQPKNDSAQRESTQTTTQQEQTPLDNNGKIINFLWEMKQNNAKDRTISNWSIILKKLAEHTDMTPESVKEYLIKTTEWSTSTKKHVVSIFSCFLKHYGIAWKRPKYEPPNKLHFIPIEADLDVLIAGSGKTLAAFLQFLKETAARGGEAANTKWKDVDFERKVVYITPEKGSNARILNISDKLIGMLNRVPKKHGDKIFSKFSNMQYNYNMARKRLMYKLQKPHLKEIRLHTFRHWKATMHYHQTKEIVKVKELLGHRNINNTMIYVHLENSLFKNTSDEYIIKIAETVKEACALLEVGFEYVTGEYTDGGKIFRKRK